MNLAVWRWITCSSKLQTHRAAALPINSRVLKMSKRMWMKNIYTKKIKQCINKRQARPALPGVEGHPTRACEPMLASVAPQVLARWPLSSSSFSEVLSALLPFGGLVPPHVPRLSHALSLAPDQATTQAGEQQERQVELADLEVQLSMLAAQRERRRGQQ